MGTNNLGRSAQPQLLRASQAIVEERRNESCITSPSGEDGFTERILAAWGVDGHNHTPTSVRLAVREGYHSGWVSIDQVRITPTRK